MFLLALLLDLPGESDEFAVPALTDRERDVLAASVDGATVADIAAQPDLSESTVRNYLSAAIGKTGARNRIEAAYIARGNGWL